MKSEATQAVKDKTQQEVMTEAKAALGEKGPRNKDFADYVLNHTEVNVTSVRETGNAQYELQLNVHTVSPEARKVIYGILANSDFKRTSGFNFSDGLELVHHERPEIPMNSDQKLLMHMHEADGQWVVGFMP